MDVLFAILLITYFVKNAVMDVAYAVRGQTPPRLQIRWEAARRHSVEPPRPRRYRMSDYFRDLWHDSWEDARGRREAKCDRSAEAQQDDSSEPAAPAEQVPPRQAETPPGVHATTAPLAVVTPIRSQQKGDQMPTPNPETTTLAAAKAYAVAMADATREAVASVEQTRAHLVGSQVSGQAVALLAEAQDLAGQLEAKFRAAYQELAKQDSVKDAYQAVPGAGSKEFVTSE